MTPALTNCEFCGIALTDGRGVAKRICGGIECVRARARKYDGSSYKPPTACVICSTPLALRPFGHSRGRQLAVCSEACKQERRKRQQAALAKRTREKRVAAAKARAKANPEKARQKAREYTRRWKDKNPEKWREIRQRWCAANPHIIKARQALVRGNRCAGLGHCTRPQWEARKSYYGGRCWIPGCDRDGDTMDHVIPLANGGSNWPANLRPACKRHNSGRRNMHWRTYLARLAA